jgi:hypothetical protein
MTFVVRVDGDEPSTMHTLQLEEERKCGCFLGGDSGGSVVGLGNSTPGTRSGEASRSLYRLRSPAVHLDIAANIRVTRRTFS